MTALLCYMSQVQLSATVNVTIPYVFQGISKWTPAATAAMQQAASAAAGGYDPSCIMVLLDTPDFGMKVADFLDSDPASIRNVSSACQCPLRHSLQPHMLQSSQHLHP